MAIKETFKHLKDLLCNISHDLDKAENGNKAASQRVRTGTVKLEKIAKLYRKESIKTEKATKGTKRPAKKAAHKKVTHKKVTHKKVTKVSAKPKAKAHKSVSRARPMSFKRPTAKLPMRRAYR